MFQERDPCILLELLRDQRPGLVSNKQQYQFFVGAFCEEVSSLLLINIPIYSIYSTDYVINILILPSKIIPIWQLCYSNCNQFHFYSDNI